MTWFFKKFLKVLFSDEIEGSFFRIENVLTLNRVLNTQINDCYQMIVYRNENEENWYLIDNW